MSRHCDEDEEEDAFTAESTASESGMFQNSDRLKEMSLFDFCFMAQSTHSGHIVCSQLIILSTLFLGSLPKYHVSIFSPLTDNCSVDLNQQYRENGRRNYFMTRSLQKMWLNPRIEPATSPEYQSITSSD